MLRIAFIILTGLFGLPGILISLKKVAYDTNKTEEERWVVAKKIVSFIISHGNIEPICTGLENLPEKSGFLITPNHQGLFDPVLIASTQDRFLSAVVKIELASTIFVKDLIALLFAHPMDRENLRQSMGVIRETTNDLKNGRTMIIFPEGTRSKNGNEMLAFKGGSFKAAINAKAPIVPCAIIDSYLVFDSNSIKKAHPQVHFLEPLYYEEYEALSAQEIADMVQERIANKIAECTK